MSRKNRLSGERDGSHDLALCLLVALCLYPAAMTAAEPAIVISEIMYHPVEYLEGTNVIDGDEFEFLELYNAGASPYDLKDCSLANGVSYTFTVSTVLDPGEYIVVVEDDTNFAKRYPWVTNAAPGKWAGKLSNSGETIVFKDSAGDPVFSVTYNDSSSWPQRADGLGTSLVLVDTSGDPNSPTNWCDSDMLHGTPGTTGRCATADIVINEILAHTDAPLEDAVELRNLSFSNISIVGWFLSDDVKVPQKYTISNVTVLATNYSVFYEYQFNTNAMFDTNNTPFALSSAGDQLYLTAPASTNQLRLVDMIEFDATVNGVSVGRSPDGTGSFTIMDELTFGTSITATNDPGDISIFRTGTGASNVAPRIGPVIINEIMYHPLQTNEGLYEYVELKNVSAAPVDISGWLISGARFTVPTGTVMGSGEYLVCAASSNTIKTAYGINNVIGDWTWSLQNNGETLVLRTAESAAVDRVTYEDGEPWPVPADGYGPSLERFSSDVVADRASSWGASRADTNWQHVVWTQTVGATSADLSIWLDFEGRCIIDDVSVKLNGTGPELVTNGQFTAGTNGWSFSGNHARSRVVASEGRGGGNGLVIAGNLTRLTYPPGTVRVHYGDSTNHHARSDTFATTPGQDYVTSYWVKRLGISENILASLEGAAHAFPLAHRGTPGSANSVASAALPLGLAVVSHDTNIVGVGIANIVRARITGSAAASNVLVQYRTAGTNSYRYTDLHYATLAMADDGISPDTTAGDREYAVSMPAITTNRTIVRYHVLAHGYNGFVARAPAPDDPSTDYGYWVESSPVQTAIPNWHLLVDGGPIVYSNALRACAVGPDGQVFTDVRVRHRGRISSSSPERTGIALRFWRGRLYDAWFAKNQDGINFRHRLNDSDVNYRRIVNEYLAYHLQRTVGLTTPHFRHTAVWIDGFPTITGELESPSGDFLRDHGLPTSNYISRAGYTGRRIVDGDPALDNLSSVNFQVDTVTGADKTGLFRTNLWLESVRPAMAVLSLTANADQHFTWNMFQYRRADNGSWSEFPWDVDLSFNDETVGSPGTYLPELHPYYETTNNPSIWDSGAARTLGKTMFAPETGPEAIYTLPYRYRHQMSLWRCYHTLFTTNYLYPILDDMETSLSPAYAQTAAVTGDDETRLTNQVARVKTFITLRRAFLHDGAWSDRNTDIWNVGNVYNPTGVVINEIMWDPTVGGEYIEFYNRGTQTVDLSWWTLSAGGESYHLPHGAMLGPTSYLVVADMPLDLTNTYSELSNPAETVRRHTGLPLWDQSINYLSETEYSTRIAHVPALSLPNNGSSITLVDLLSNVVDTVTYGVSAPWPSGTGASLELLYPESDNADASQWRRSLLVGTPGTANTATNDLDGDTLIDSWEQQIVDASGGVLTNITQVSPFSDEDSDGLSNEHEFVYGTSPITNAAAGTTINIILSNNSVLVWFDTAALSGEPAYRFYSGRYYTLQGTDGLLPASAWTNVPGFIELPGNGTPISYTNALGRPRGYYRYNVELKPNR